MTTIARVAAALIAAALLLPATAGAFAGKPGTIAVEGHASAQGRLVLRNADGTAHGVLTLAGRPAKPAFSAAGLRIAYASGGRIWVAQADGVMQRPLTSGYSDADPAWSPLGDRIAYTSGPAGGRDIWSIGTDGNLARRMTFNIADELSPTYSSRGDLAFVRITDNGDGNLWRINATGGSRKLTTGAPDDRDPAWSPDGRRIVFTRATPGHRDVYIANSLGHHIRKLRTLPRKASAPVFSPDGRRIAFLMGKPGHLAVWTMHSNGKGLKRLVAPWVRAKSLDWSALPGDPVIAGAGDIACDPYTPGFNDGFPSPSSCHQMATSDELLRMDLNKVFMLGDAQYEDGAAAKFALSYDPSWGRLKPITVPVIGNHEYADGIGQGYFDYFDGPGNANGPAGPRGEGWYSFDIGAWHVVALNSNCDEVSCEAGGAQEQWLRADLAAHPAACTLAIMHHPLFASGPPDEAGEATPMAVSALWQALYDYGADLVWSGHNHSYERFQPLNPQAQVDPRGMRLLITGTGGKNLAGASSLRAGSEGRQGQSFGVTRIVLHPASYDWQFIPDTPGGYTDAGSAACH